MQQHIFEPLEMKDTYFHLPKEKQARLVSLYEWNKGSLDKVTHQLYEGVNPLFPTLQGSYLSGGAGLSSTMEDYAHFLSMLLNKGIYKDKKILSRKTVELMLTNQLTDKMSISPNPAQAEDFQFSLGGFAVETAKNDYLSPFSIGSFTWGGAFNTHAWADPQEKLIGLLFTQEYLSPWYSIGEEFKVLTYQALRD
jgi:CubicO group peptidase (beta-lactamase class C family)